MVQDGIYNNHYKDPYYGWDDHQPYIYIYIYIWVNYNDLTVLPHWNHGFYMGNHSQMAARFRFVNYYSLPIYI